VLVVTRKPRRWHSLIAATASSNTPSLHTDASCRSQLKEKAFQLAGQ
jgi:hypothetical protein